MVKVEKLIEPLARAMEPEGWAEYDAGNGVCTNDAGWKVLDSIDRAKRALIYLHDHDLLKGENDA